MDPRTQASTDDPEVLIRRMLAVIEQMDVAIAEIQAEIARITDQTEDHGRDEQRAARGE